MADVVSKKKRSEMMAGIQNKNTKPETVIRKALHAKGFRYKLHDKSLPGSPDLVFPKYNAVIQIQGCFWHGHGCHLFKWPSTRVEFWKNKIGGNKERDLSNNNRLMDLGWRLLLIWECAYKGPFRMDFAELILGVEKWLQSDNRFMTLSGIEISPAPISPSPPREKQ